MTLWSGMPRRMDSRRPTTGQNGRSAQIAVVPQGKPNGSNDHLRSFANHTDRRPSADRERIGTAARRFSPTRRLGRATYVVVPLPSG